METKPSSHPISLNCRVLVDLVDTSGQAERREFRLVPSKQADFKSGLLDENTPLGRRLLGHHAGETVPYQAGDLKEVRILEVQTGKDLFPRMPPPDAGRLSRRLLPSRKSPTR